MYFLTPAVIILAITCGKSLAYDNDWDGNVDKTCPDGQFISRIVSIHDNGKEDRRWTHTCANVPSGGTLSNGSGDCVWHNNVNEYDELLAFRCPGQMILTGVKSTHDNSREDRRFSYRCCEYSLPLAPCSFSSFLNNYDGSMDYQVPAGTVLVGFASQHNNGKEDRRWKAEHCSP